MSFDLGGIDEPYGQMPGGCCLTHIQMPLIGRELSVTMFCNKTATMGHFRRMPRDTAGYVTGPKTGHNVIRMFRRFPWAATCHDLAGPLETAGDPAGPHGKVMRDKHKLGIQPYRKPKQHCKQRSRNINHTFWGYTYILVYKCDMVYN